MKRQELITHVTKSVATHGLSAVYIATTFE